MKNIFKKSDKIAPEQIILNKITKYLSENKNLTSKNLDKIAKLVKSQLATYNECKDSNLLNNQQIFINKLCKSLKIPENQLENEIYQNNVSNIKKQIVSELGVSDNASFKSALYGIDDSKTLKIKSKWQKTTGAVSSDPILSSNNRRFKTQAKESINLFSGSTYFGDLRGEFKSDDESIRHMEDSAIVNQFVIGNNKISLMAVADGLGLHVEKYESAQISRISYFAAKHALRLMSLQLQNNFDDFINNYKRYLDQILNQVMTELSYKAELDNSTTLTICAAIENVQKPTKIVGCSLGDSALSGYNISSNEFFSIAPSLEDLNGRPFSSISKTQIDKYIRFFDRDISDNIILFAHTDGITSELPFQMINKNAYNEISLNNEKMQNLLSLYQQNNPAFTIKSVNDFNKFITDIVICNAENKRLSTLYKIETRKPVLENKITKLQNLLNVNSKILSVERKLSDIEKKIKQKRGNNQDQKTNSPKSNISSNISEEELNNENKQEENFSFDKEYISFKQEYQKLKDEHVGLLRRKETMLENGKGLSRKVQEKIQENIKEANTKIRNKIQKLVQEIKDLSPKNRGDDATLLSLQIGYNKEIWQNKLTANNKDEEKSR